MQSKIYAAKWVTVAFFTTLLVLFISGCKSDSVNAASSAKVGAPVDARLIQHLRKISYAGLERKTDPSAESFHAVSGSRRTRSLPTVLYIGADFCPHCATLRWPLLLALMRFGHFDGLRYMRSDSKHQFADIVTFSFRHSEYDSDYLLFRSVDTADRFGHPLQEFDRFQMRLFKKFDVKPYASIPGAIPFVYMGGRYTAIGSTISPESLANLTWAQVIDRIRRQTQPLSGRVLGMANLYTAAFCSLTGRQPRKVCNRATIKAAVAELPKMR